MISSIEIFATASAVVFVLFGLNIVANTGDVNYLYIGLSLLALHFGIPFSIPINRRRSISSS